MTTMTMLMAVAAALLAADPAAPAAAAKPTDCKAFGNGPCCDPAVAAHLPRSAIFSACRETPDSYLGERGGKDTCRYVFKSGKDEAAEKDPGFVEIYVPKQKQVPSEPSDPFFAWSKVGKAFVTSRATSPKSAPMLAASTGIWLPGDGYFVSVNASTKVCTRGEAQKLAKSVR